VSIIAEALKKAKESQEHKSRPAIESIIARRTLRARVFLIAACMTVALSVSLFFLFSTLAPHKKQATAESNMPIENSSYVLETVPPAAGTRDVVTEDETPAVVPDAPVTLAEVNASIKLNGIMYTPEKPLAVINDSIWTEGDIVGKFKILEIGKDFVKVGHGKSEFNIRLKK
jgi:hypothetical protein